MTPTALAAIQDFAILLEEPRTSSPESTWRANKAAADQRARLDVVLAVVKQAAPSQTPSVDIATVCRSLTKCAERDAAPPFACVRFFEDVATRWARDISQALQPYSGHLMSIADVTQLQRALRKAIQAGMYHSSHASLVDQGRNPGTLCEYIQCIKLIWIEGRGVCTPASLQALQKLSACSPECVSLIVEYASTVASRADVFGLYRALNSMQTFAWTAYGNSGMSTTAAQECISSTKFSTAAAGILDAVRDLLSSVWDSATLMVHSSQTVSVAGLSGSHVDTLYVPRRIAQSASCKLLVNYLNSALPLSRPMESAAQPIMLKSNDSLLRSLRRDTALELWADADRKAISKLSCCDAEWGALCDRASETVARAVGECLEVQTGRGALSDRVCTVHSNPSNLHIPASGDYAVLQFGNAASPLRTFYTFLAHIHALTLRAARFAFCREMCLSCERGVISESLSVHEDTNSVVSLLQERREVHMPSSVNKVCIAGTLFDLALELHFKRRGGVVDGSLPRGALAESAATNGKVFSDLLRIVTDRGVDRSVSVDLRRKCILHTNHQAVVCMLEVLVEYMDVNSKSRRKRSGEMLKKNAVPNSDKRKKARSVSEDDAAA